MLRGFAKACMNMSNQPTEINISDHNEPIDPALIQKKRNERVRSDIKRWKSQIKTESLYLGLWFVPLLALSVVVLFNIINEATIEPGIIIIMLSIMWFGIYGVYSCIKGICTLRKRIWEYENEIKRFDLSGVKVVNG